MYPKKLNKLEGMGCPVRMTGTEQTLSSRLRAREERAIKNNVS